MMNSRCYAEQFRSRLAIPAFASLAFVSGCASITAEPVSYEDRSKKGVLIYAPMPYLSATAPVSLSVNSYLSSSCPNGDSPPAAASITPTETSGQADSTLTQSSEQGGSALDRDPKPEENTPSAGKPTGDQEQGGKPSAAPAESDSSSLEIIYLPDFCQAQAVRITNVLAVNKSSLKLDNGWMLTELNADLDSTTIADSLIGAIKEVRLAEIGIDTQGDEAETAIETSGSERETGTIYRVTEEQFLRPGIYEIFSRSSNDCSRPELDMAGFRNENNYVTAVKCEVVGKP